MDALSTTHVSFAEGNDLAKRYPVDVAPIAATRDQSAESYDSLGRFRIRAPELGSYVGIHEAGRLVAMAGEGLRFPRYTEINAVCTHPERRGRGYVSSLVPALIQKITRQDEIPFLHVGRENADAIRKNKLVH